MADLCIRNATIRVKLTERTMIIVHYKIIMVLNQTESYEIEKPLTLLTSGVQKEKSNAETQ